MDDDRLVSTVLAIHVLSRKQETVGQIPRLLKESV